MRKIIICLLAAVVFPCAAGPQTFAQDAPKIGDNVVVHIALVVPDIERAARAYAELLGVPTPRVSLTDTAEKTNIRFRGKPTGARAKLAFLRAENIAIELIEPVGGPSTWREFLDRHGAGVHHIAFKVKGMTEHVARLEKKGGRLLQSGDFAGGSYAYVDLTAQLGLIVELLTEQDK